MTVQKAFEEVLERIERAKVFGHRKLGNGTQLFGHVPHVAPEAWLHETFAPLSSRDVASLEKILKRKIPDVYRDFLTTCSNGLMVFSGRLSLDGFRTSYKRTGDDTRQPFAIDTPNLFERPKDSYPNQFFIGGYGYDGSMLYIDGTRVCRCSKNTVMPLNEWESFATMLISETSRLASLFDETGRKKDPDLPTTP